jgi:hypothetical protein
MRLEEGYAVFVQVIRGHTSDANALRARLDLWARELAPAAVGWLGSTAGVTADGTAIALARFESADAARRNSERPEQGQWWTETAKLFAGDVTFHDCPQVHLFAGGGSDDAGFVQIMQGRYTEPQKAIELMLRSEGPLRELRPEVLGGQLCLHGDGGFTQAVYFTSEVQARTGEKKPPPPQVQELLDEEAAITTDLVFYDLTDPWLHAPR